MQGEMLGAIDSEVILSVGALVAGFISGILSALMGIGGAIVTTPVVRLLGATPIEAVGSTVPAILPGAISGAWRYAKEGMVEWRLALTLGISGALFSVFGAWTSDQVNGRLLMVLTAAVMLWSGLSVILKLRSPALNPSGMEERRDESEVPLRRSAPALTSLGALGGFVAGLLGVGGGIIVVPMLTGPLHIPMRRAVASSLVAVAIYQIPALATHIWLGHVNWALALPLVAGVIPGAQVGAHITIGSSDRTIRIMFGFLVVVVAVVYGVTEILGLISE